MLFPCLAHHSKVRLRVRMPVSPDFAGRTSVCFGVSDFQDLHAPTAKQNKRTRKTKTITTREAEEEGTVTWDARQKTEDRGEDKIELRSG